MAINVIQISALLVFGIMAIAYRTNHPDGSQGWHLSNGTPVIDYNVAPVTGHRNTNNKPVQATCVRMVRPAEIQTTNNTNHAGKWSTTQDRQVVADDLDKTKNTNAGGVGQPDGARRRCGSDPYPAWERRTPRAMSPSSRMASKPPTRSSSAISPADALSGSGTTCRAPQRSITTRMRHIWPGRSRMGLGPYWSRRSTWQILLLWSVSSQYDRHWVRRPES